MTGRLDRSGTIFSLLPLRGGPLGPRLRKCLLLTETGSRHLRSLLLLRIEMSDEAIGADQNGSGADLNEDVGDDL